MNPDLIHFRPLEGADLPRLHGWLHQPHVRQWWGEPPTLAAVEAKYLPRIRGESATQSFLILYGNGPIGYIQKYRIRNYPEYAAVIQVGEQDAGLDLFIGEPDYLGRGVGSEAVRRFLRQVVFADPEVEGCVLGPAVGNLPAIRCYQKAGFRPLKTVQVPGEPEPEFLLRITRKELPD